MKHRRLVLLIGVMTAVGFVGCVVKAVQRFRQPFPAWMAEADQWYDAALGAAVNAVIAGACFAHLYRTGRRDPALAAGPTRWADRVELRTAMYAFVAFLALQLPVGVVKTVRGLNDPGRPPWERPFLSLFPKMMVVGPVVAVVVIWFDRRQLRLEAREATNVCRVCGYDLRATPERCPECGAVRGVRA